MDRGRLLRLGAAPLAVVLFISAGAVAAVTSGQDEDLTTESAAQSAELPTTARAGATDNSVTWAPAGFPLTQAQIRAARTEHAALAAGTARQGTLKPAKAKKDRHGEPVKGFDQTTAIPTAATQKSREIQSLVKKHFPDSQIGNAMAVAACESGHSDAIGATNSDGTTDWGAFQLNDGGTLQGSLSAIGVGFESKEKAQKLALNTSINVRAAASIYASRGWGPWVCAYKIGIVSSLYGNGKGPMYGKFNDMGVPTVKVPTITVGPGATKEKESAKKTDQKGPKKVASKTPAPTPARQAPVTTASPPAPSPAPVQIQPTPASPGPSTAIPTTTPTPSPSPSTSVTADQQKSGG